MKRLYLFTVLVMLMVVSGCQWKRDRLNVDVSDIAIPETRIHRYEADLFAIPVSDLRRGLEAIRGRYYFFLGTDLSDPKKLEEMTSYLTNPRNIEFQRASALRYGDMSDVEKELSLAFRHWKYYFPGVRIPRVYTYISGGDYASPVRLADSVMIIALDAYLGADYKPYLTEGLPAYKISRMTRDHIVPDCVTEIVGSLYPENTGIMTLLDGMIDAGKRLYLADALIPGIPGYLKLGYTPAQYEWARKNEVHVWAAIIENRMLYSSDGQNFRMLLADGPCTMEFTKESPPRLGEWIGLQIVRAWMQNNPGTSLMQMMQEKDSQKILTLSGYKPEK